MKESSTTIDEYTITNVNPMFRAFPTKIRVSDLRELWILSSWHEHISIVVSPLHVPDGGR